MSRRPLEIRQVGAAHEAALARFLVLLRERGVERFFHPHPLTMEAARERATYAGKDVYCVLSEDDEILAYGMLRGSDEGYEVPSLGIVVHPDAQKQGLGRLLMDFLRAAALRRGAPRIRLRVHPDNEAAVRLYRSLGYELKPETDGPYWVGLLELGHR